MPTLVFATHNPNKVREIKSITKNKWDIVSLREIGLTEDIPEPFETIEENAAQKSRTIFEKTGRSCFSEDTGLEVFSLNGDPGVHSARYAGPQRDPEDNIDLLLKNLKDRKDRRAQFRTVISFLHQGEEYQFEGICKGIILKERRGTSGFGYDPVFQPDGGDKSFAEMGMEEKNKFSHRAKAFAKFVAFLESVH